MEDDKITLSDIDFLSLTDGKPPCVLDYQAFLYNFEYFDSHDLNDTPEEINRMFAGLMYNIFFLTWFRKMSFFSRQQHWDFSIFACEWIFETYKSDFEHDKKIRNIQSYLRVVLPEIRIKYIYYIKTGHYGRHQAYPDPTSEVSQPIQVTPLAELLADETDNLKELEYSQSISQIYLTAKTLVGTVPARNDAERHNIYISCLLTLFYRITNANTKGYQKDMAILFRLPQEYKPRILILVKQIQKTLVRDLCYQTQMELHSEDMIHLLHQLEKGERDDDY